MTSFEPPNFFEQIRSNHRRSMVLMAVTFLILWAFVNVVAALFGAHLREVPCGAAAYSCDPEFYANPTTLVVTGVIVGAYLAIAYFSSARAALAITHAQPATGPEYLQLRNIVEGVAIAAGVPMPAVYVVHDPAPNAFATGRNPKNAAIAVTTGLLEKMNRVELEGVVAHELSHIKNYDILVMTLAVTLVGAVAILTDIALRMMWWNGGRVHRSGDRGDRGNPFALIGIVLLIVAPLLARAMQAAVSRRRETLADVSAVQLTRYPPGLISALEKLQADSTVTHSASMATAHMWIEQPLSGVNDTGRLGFFHKLFNTHPPLADRIALL
ncbi:MAG: M48 family metallopeptidase [Actinomycetota bacterium]